MRGVHIHVTLNAPLYRVRDIVAKHEGLRGLKATAIHLWRNERHQLDVMLTLHIAPKPKPGHSKNQAWFSEAVIQGYEIIDFCFRVGLPLLRTKIEANLEDLTEEDPLNGLVQYIEVHTRSPNLSGTEDDPQSENLLQASRGLFLTHRSRNLIASEEFAQGILSRDPESEVWKEVVLVDTRPGLDSWWCPPT